MDRKAVANETLQIMKQGFYEYQGQIVDLSAAMNTSVQQSVLIRPGEALKAPPRNGSRHTQLSLINSPTVRAILDFASAASGPVGVLNFASAKNPGGGFRNGAMAQEESLAASSTLYKALCAHPEYYEANRAYKSMVYTNHAIYAPDVVFFRDEHFKLLQAPVTASVLTLPAVNMGQVLQKGEDLQTARERMRARMELALRIFADRGDRTLVLGAYGCGVFRNDPKEVAVWWKELLEGVCSGWFDLILFAVMDRSKNQQCYQAFEAVFG